MRVFLYLVDRERTLDNAMDKVMASLTNFASEMDPSAGGDCYAEIVDERLRAPSWRGLARRA